MTTRQALKEARRCHRTMMASIKAGDLANARYVKGFRNRWLEIARTPLAF
ncbi:hypothetical protein [Stutzerimonas nitrititolerans]|nr:hypothetical protein [Stutzerimonas nitrititolerans]